MKQFMQKITATVSALLIAIAMVGLNTDQANAKGKAGKGAKVRAGVGARIAPRMKTYENVSDADIAAAIRARSRQRTRQ